MEIGLGIDAQLGEGFLENFRLFLYTFGYVLTEASVSVIFVWNSGLRGSGNSLYMYGGSSRNLELCGCPNGEPNGSDSDWFTQEDWADWSTKYREIPL